MDGDTEVWRRVEEVITGPYGWNAFCGLPFIFNQNAPSDIRITLQPGGSWSYMGNYGLPEPRPTMQLGWLYADTEQEEYDRVCLHEFGHALGLVHEALTPWAQIPWNKPVVYAYYAKQGWTKEIVDAQVFNLFAPNVVAGSKWDPNSIMGYHIPAEFVLDKAFAHPAATRLSDMDKQEIQKWYGPPAKKYTTSWFPGVSKGNDSWPHDEGNA